MIRESNLIEWAKTVAEEPFEVPGNHIQILPPGIDPELVRQAQEAYLKVRYGSSKVEVKMVMVPLLIPIIKDEEYYPNTVGGKAPASSDNHQELVINTLCQVMTKASDL